MEPIHRSQGRPTTLSVRCDNCDAKISYDPNIEHRLCASCENLVAPTMASDYQRFDDDEFVSALEDVEGEEDDDDCDNDSSMTEHGLIGKEHRGDDMDIDGEETDGGDLFSTAFVDQPDAPEDSDEDEPPAPIESTFIATEHTKGCTSSRGPSTPPPEKSRSSSAQLAGPRPPNPHRDLSWNLRRLNRFYLRAKELIPRLPLAEHRYWIGVLSVKNKPDNFKDEKDFLWLKGNRMTTVETVSARQIMIL